MLTKERFSSIIIFLLFFLGMYRYIGEFLFDSDEGDIFVGGMAISHGVTLYTEFLSQHMPFSYFISALFWLFGADSVYSQRICFYLFYATFWLLIVKRYASQFTKIALVLSFLVFISFTGQIYLGTQILSEYIAAIGFVILFLEFVRYSTSEKREFGLTESSLISFSILCTFGTTFVSAFALLPLVIGFLVTFIKKQLAISSKSLSSWQVVVRSVSDCKYLISIILLPWIAFLVYCVLTDSLKDCLYWTYAFNRDIYSKYCGGFGTSITHVLREAISSYFTCFSNLVASVLNDKFSIGEFTKLSIYMLSLLYVIQNIINKKYLLGIVALFLIIYTGTRGMFNFHSTPQTMLMCMMSSLFLVTVYKISKENIHRLVVVFAFFVLFIPYLSIFNGYPSFKTRNYVESDISSYIRAITNKGDTVWNFALATNAIVMNSGRVTVYQFANTPWLWEATGMPVIEKLKKDLPKVIIYRENQDVWGHKIADYAQGLSDFMAENYVNYVDIMYIRKDYYQTALSILNSFNLNSDTVIGEIYKDSVFEQEVMFKQSDFSKIGLLMATYARKNKSYLHISLVDAQNGEIVFQKKVKAWHIDDNAWMYFDVDQSKISSEKKYVIRLSSDAELGNGVTWYASPKNSGKASVNGNVIEGGFAWKLM